MPGLEKILSFLSRSSASGPEGSVWQDCDLVESVIINAWSEQSSFLKSFFMSSLIKNAGEVEREK